MPVTDKKKLFNLEIEDYFPNPKIVSKVFKRVHELDVASECSDFLDKYMSIYCSSKTFFVNFKINKIIEEDNGDKLIMLEIKLNDLKLDGYCPLRINREMSKDDRKKAILSHMMSEHT